MRAVALAVFLASAAVTSVASAQYAFSIPRMRMTNVIQPDASVAIEYEIEFENAAWGQAIDVVDIGLPHEGYDLSTMEASIDGEPLSRISPSSYIDVGVEVSLGTNAIGSGQRGTFRFRAVMPDMVYNDTTDDALASFRITPTWFDASLVQGTTDLEIAVQMPPGVAPDSVVYQNVPFTHKAAYNDTTLVGWRWESAAATGPSLVGVSFPRAAMERVVHITKLELFLQWFEGNPFVRVVTAAIVLGLFAIFFFRWSGGTGCSVFGFAVAAVGAIYWFSPVLQLLSIPVFILLFGLMEWRLQRKRRVYLPPIAQVEGGGIKRGLTAPEAAVILEYPLGKVLALVIFGMLKKGIVRQTRTDPLTVVVNPEFSRKDRADRRAAAAARGVVIHTYEHGFLDAIDNASFGVAEIDFSSAMRGLIEHVAERMIGFDLSDTKDYYRTMIARAWELAKGIGEIEQRDKHVDKNLEWMLLDEGWSEGFEGWDRGGYRYTPIWIRTGPTHAGGMGLPSIGTGGGGGGGGHSVPSFGDVSASFAGWTENVTGQLASVISPTSLAVGADAGKGVVNLSGADHVTGEVLSAFFSGSGGGGGGGGGGGCACACAGCACACACAGGGR